MRCPNCGQRLSDTVVRCPSCGFSITEEERIRQIREEKEEERLRREAAERQQEEEQARQLSQGRSSQAPAKRGFFDVGLSPNDPFYGKMKWYWFIVHVQLFLSALSFMINGFMYLSGSIYGDQAAALYEAYPGFALLDKCYGIFALGMAVLAFFTRGKLRDFRRGADRQLILYYILSLAGTIVYIAVEMILVGQNLITADLIMSIVISLFMILVNMYYFRRRKHLFNH